jgi:hypothetical protein
MRKTLRGFALLGLMVLLGLSEGHGEPLAAETPGRRVVQAVDGSVALPAEEAKIEGPNARFEEGEKGIAWWTNVDTSLHWIAKIDKPGKYRVELNFNVLGNATHGELSIAAGDQTTEAVLSSGTGMNDFKWGDAGDITIRKPGEIPVTVTAREKGHEFVMYLRSIVLRPAGLPSPNHGIDVSGSPIKAADDGAFNLLAADAEVNGLNAVVENYDPKNVGYWKELDTFVRWQIAVQKPGKYRVEMNYSLVPSEQGSKVAILVGDQKVAAMPKAGSSWSDYKEGSAGDVTITGTGIIPVVVKPLSKPANWVVNLRSVTLAPAALPTTAIDISDTPARQARDGSIRLTADGAEIDGQAAKLEGGDKKYVVWMGSSDGGILWPAVVDQPGRFDVMVTYSLAQTGKASNVMLSAGGQSIAGNVLPGHGWDDFKTANLGTVDIRSKGDLQVALTSSTAPGVHIMNLRSVELVPLRK